ncbi:hypothetical protein Q0590_00355 [Rhodocytophaga aerolata]|uniref:Uncharacterized protein n=1 Tax=Rhodocytophaga aerolata TaxID=455078 RepID=A0ABT8QXV7_9BACT|nr:hypothetical protein [Rhodocytophaga aerolata]MDO1444675.1 hypothetical protein [Rhodocytophaga aerolata]
MSSQPITQKLYFARRCNGLHKCLLILLLCTCLSTYSFSQFVVTDFYNGVINTVSQVIQSASKIINSEAFKQAKKALEKLKEIEGGVQQFRRIQETVEFIQSSTQSYKQALSIITEDRHFAPNEIASFYSGLEKLAKQDAKLLDDLSAGIKANVVEMNSAERMQFIMKIHGDAAASAARLKAFVGGIEYLSLRRCRTKKDQLATMQLYAMSRNANFNGTVSQVDFGNYERSEIDIEQLEKDGRNAAGNATKEQMEWLTDPNNPQAKENAIKNLLNDPMPQRPNPPGKKASEEEVQRFFELNHYYNDRLENWQTNHQKDLQVLGTDKANFVMSKPPTLTDKEWMEVIVNKLRKGQL